MNDARPIENNPNTESADGAASGPIEAKVLTTWRELVRVHGLMRRLSEPHMARFGLSPAQWGVLRALTRLEDRGVREPRMHELGTELLIQPPSLSKTLDRMLRMGLVTRREDSEDLRSRRIGLTDAGRKLLAGALDAHRAWVEGMMSALSPSEQERLGVMLAKLSAHMTDLANAPSNEQGALPLAKRSRSSR